MFNDIRTQELFGYSIDSLSEGSHKKIATNCDICGEERICERRAYYNGLCRKCSKNTKEFKEKSSIAHKKSYQDDPTLGRRIGDSRIQMFKDHPEKLDIMSDIMTAVHKNNPEIAKNHSEIMTGRESGRKLDLDDNKICSMYLNGSSTYQISDIIGCSVQTIIRRLNDNGVEIRKLDISVDMWVKENQGKHICACGCGQYIIIKPQHHQDNVGIPKYIVDHYKNGDFGEAWVKENQGKHICACGCGEPITIKPHHRFDVFGIPKYISGHNSKLDINKVLHSERMKLYYEQPGNKDLMIERVIKYNINRRWNNIIGDFVTGSSIYDFTHSVGDYGIDRDDYEEWRKAVGERDNWQCQLCGFKNGVVHAHHIIPKYMDRDLILNIDNGIILCPDCHKGTYNNEIDFIDIFQDIINGGLD